MPDLHSPLHLIVLAVAVALCLAAMVSIHGHRHREISGRRARIAWSVAVLLLPIVGPLLWFAVLGLETARRLALVHRTSARSGS